VTTCERCGREVMATITSMFNTETICVDRCKPAERAHPLYEEARRHEGEAVARGDHNFPGIGLPPELRGGGWR